MLEHQRVACLISVTKVCLYCKVLVGIAGGDGPWNSQSRISSIVEPGAHLVACSPASDLDGKHPAESRAQPQRHHYGITVVFSLCSIRFSLSICRPSYSPESLDVV